MNAPKASGIDANTIAAQVDELGELERTLAPVQLKLKRVDVLRKAIREHFDASPAGSAFEARGDRYVVAVGERAMVRTYHPGKLIKAIGLKVFASFATCTLKAIEDHCTPEVVAGVVTASQTGIRSLKTYERGAE